MRSLLLTLIVLTSCSRDDAADAPAPPMTFPERPAARAVPGGVQFYDVALLGKAPGQTMRVWIYLPPGKHAAGSLPCVLVAPAGSNLVTGMKLGDGDRDEHLPYASAGFAVVSYELDGAMPETESEQAIAAAAKAYVASKGGVLNARTALDYVAARVPEVNPNRIYTAGHSSAGTVGLIVAATDKRVKGAVAYAPAVSIRKWLGPRGVGAMDRAVPGFAEFADFGSPAERVNDLKKPVMLFIADDDTTVQRQTVIDFYHQLKAAGSDAKLVTVPTGGHYEAMIEKGIPAGIAWLKQQSGATP